MKTSSFKVIFPQQMCSISGNDGTIAEKWGENPRNNPGSKTKNVRDDITQNVKNLSQKWFGVKTKPKLIYL